jgi:hypothetical protein
MVASAQARRILIVAQSSERVGAVAAAMLRCRQAHRCRFTLLVPAVAHGLHRVVDPEDQCCAEAERTIGLLAPRLNAAAGAAMVCKVGSHEPLAAIQDALNRERFDEVLIAAHAGRLARWARIDLASKVRALGVMVTLVPSAG